MMALATQVQSRSQFEPQPAGKFNQSFVWLLAVIAAMGGLLFGYDWVTIGGAKPSILFFLLLMLAPEMPRWLARKGQLQRARRVPERIGGARYADATLAEIMASLGRAGEKVGLGPVFERVCEGSWCSLLYSPCFSSSAASMSCSITPKRSSRPRAIASPMVS
jgi:Sugar (and other) transporter